LRWFKDDMSNHGLILISEFSKKLVHEENLENGTLLNYRKEEDDPVKVIEQQIADLEKRLPIHSVPPAMIQRLEDLEEQLEKLRNEK
jgi:hypothetical protein